MRFRKKKEKVFNLTEELKKHPDTMYVCDTFVAVYLPAVDKALYIYGNFNHLNEQELNDLLIEKFTQLQASMN